MKFVFAMAVPAFGEPGLYAQCKGRILEASTGREVEFASIASELARADFVLFGERHGVREHAAASACVLSAFARSDRPVALVMEMLSRDDQDALDAWREAHPETAAGLGTTLRWWRRGWPAFDTWLPLIDRAYGLRMPLYGGGLRRGEEIPHELTAPQHMMLIRRLGNVVDTVRASWEEAMGAAHCGLLTPQEVGRLALHQIRRDLSMADVAVAAAEGERSALIQTGRGHSRKDRSLYVALDHETAGSLVSIGAFTEQEEVLPAQRDVHDFLWIVGTQASANSPCAYDGGPVRQAGKEGTP